jgi:hypothetical protein
MRVKLLGRSLSARQRRMLRAPTEYGHFKKLARDKTEDKQTMMQTTTTRAFPATTACDNPAARRVRVICQNHATNQADRNTKMMKHAFGTVLFGSLITFTPNANALQIIQANNISSNISTTSPYANFSAGSLGDLCPKHWGIPYNGTNPTMALFMSSAGITSKAIINIAVIFCLYTYWSNEDEGSSI